MRLILLAALVIAFPAAGSAQVQVQGGQLLDREFSAASSDSSIVHLEARRVYRAELSGAAAGSRPVITHVRARGGRAVVARTGAESRPALAVFEVYAREEGPHVVRVSGLEAGTTARLVLRADSAALQAQADRRRARLRKTWTIGVRLGVGRQGEFALSPDEIGGGGTSLDGALRFASTNFPVSLLLGGWHQAGSATATRDVVWFYAEPQVQLLRSNHLEFALLAQAAQGNAEGMTVDPRLYAGGAQLTYSFGNDPARRGFAAHARYSYGSISNTLLEADAAVHSLLFGVLWTM